MAPLMPTKEQMHAERMTEQAARTGFGQRFGGRGTAPSEKDEEEAVEPPEAPPVPIQQPLF